MNVLFHTATAIGVAVLIIDTEKIKPNLPLQKTFLTAFITFIIGIISHGVLDYVPHCYPIPAKIDAMIGLLIILGVTFLAQKNYRLIVFCAFVGSIFPDLIDLLPAILNKYLGLQISIAEKFFPWHFHEYSGSIYSSKCSVSTFNHLMLLFALSILVWSRKKDAKTIFSIHF